MSARERRLAFIVGCLIAVIAGWKAIVSPVLTKARGLRERAAAAAAAIDGQNALAERGEAIKARDAQLFTAANLADIGTVEAVFLEFVNRSAEGSGVRISSERPSNSVHPQTRGRGGYAEIQVALTGEGTLDAFVQFLQRLSSGDKPLRVMAASLSRTDRAGIVAVNMRLSTVVVKEGVR